MRELEDAMEETTKNQEMEELAVTQALKPPKEIPEDLVDTSVEQEILAIGTKVVNLLAQTQGDFTDTAMEQEILGYGTKVVDLPAQTPKDFVGMPVEQEILNYDFAKEEVNHKLIKAGGSTLDAPDSALEDSRKDGTFELSAKYDLKLPKAGPPKTTKEFVTARLVREMIFGERDSIFVHCALGHNALAMNALEYGDKKALDLFSAFRLASLFYPI